MHRAAHGRHDGLGLEDVELLFAHGKTNGARDLVAVHQRGDDEDALIDLSVGFLEGVLGGLGHDDLVGLAVDHELPPALVDVLAVRVGPDGEAPLLKQVDGAVDVTGDGSHQVVTGDAHQVLLNVVDVILDGVLAAGDINVLVDRRQAHGDRTGAVHGSLVHEGDLDVILLGPIRGLDSGAAGGHAAAQDQQVGCDLYSFPVSHLEKSPSKFPSG